MAAYRQRYREIQCYKRERANEDENLRQQLHQRLVSVSVDAGLLRSHQHWRIQNRLARRKQETHWNGGVLEFLGVHMSVHIQRHRGSGNPLDLTVLNQLSKAFTSFSSSNRRNSNAKTRA